jgi:hypothetical protein
MKTDARTQKKQHNDTHKKTLLEALWGKIQQRFPRRVTFIIGNFKDQQPEQLASILNKIKPNNNVIIMESNEDVKIRKVWI